MHAPPPHRRSTRPARLSRLALLLALSAFPAPLRAAELSWRGLLDLTASESGPAYSGNRLTRADNPFDPYRVRLFVESRVDNRVQVLGQFVFADASGAYVDGAYAIVTPWPGRDLHVLAGKLPWAVGTWAPRTYSNRNPLVSAPLLYQWHTSLLWWDVPPSAGALLASAGRGQTGVDWYGFDGGQGMPIVDDSYWDVGVTLVGSRRPVEFALGVVAGAPGWGSTMEDDNSGKSVLGRFGLAPWPGVRAGVSGSHGPYLPRSAQARLPAGRSVNEYAQKLLMADVDVSWSRFELRGECADNTWESPGLGDLRVRSGYAEGKVLFPTGLYAAVRVDAQRCSEIADSTGARMPWDADVTRVEAGLGYRLTREATAKLVVQRTRLAHRAWSREHSLVGAQLSLAF